MADLAAFLTARLAEDAADAVAALNHVGLLTRADLPRWIQAITEDDVECVCTTRPMGNSMRVATCESDIFTAHIARWDPARVLNEVATKRGLLAALERNVTANDHDDRSVSAAREALKTTRSWLAEPYAQHPDFDPDWRAC